MSVDPLAGQPVPPSRRPNVSRIVAAYYTQKPDLEDAGQRVSFGTSGHRGRSVDGAFNESHVLAISQALVEHRTGAGIDGPLFVGFDTHALSWPAFVSALEVFAAHGLEVVIQDGHGFTPTPAISHAILAHNRDRRSGLADGVVVTPSHNPPEDGGFKYNPTSGGPAGSDITNTVQARANEILANGLEDVKRVPFARALAADTTHARDLVAPYVDDLGAVLDLEAVRASGVTIGVDPLGGASVGYWPRIAERWGLDLEVVNEVVDGSFGFMRIDRDGKIRMDCSSPYAMAGLVELKDRFGVAVGCDPDADRHGIVTPSAGLMNPNHYLAVAVEYLFQNRPDWPADAAIGKTLVSSSMIDRVASSTRADAGRGARSGSSGSWTACSPATFGFGGEESAGASFLRKDGTAWTTDKDGILLALLAAEITAVTGRDPGERYADLEDRFGSPVYARIDAPATLEQKAVLKDLSPDAIDASELAGDAITATLTRAPGNDAAIGGLKVQTENGLVRRAPSGTEDIYKIYAESFRGEAHLEQIQSEAKEIVSGAFASAGV